MSVAALVETAQFVVDTTGKRKAVVLDYTLWEELLTLLEDMEDAEEIEMLRKTGEETVEWETAKAELRYEVIGEKKSLS